MTGLIIKTDYTGPSRPVAERITSAFKHLEVAGWLVPGDLDERARIMAEQFDLLIGPALDGDGRVDAVLDEDGHPVGVAVWFDYTRGPIQGPPDYEERLAEICGPHLRRFQALDAAFERCHPDPVERPHHHLAFCAVDPDRQHQGVGSLLLALGLSRLDETGTAGYLEAANLPLTDWYGKHGFEGLAPLGLPEGPSMYPMWRDPFTGLTAS